MEKKNPPNPLLTLHRRPALSSPYGYETCPAMGKIHLTLRIFLMGLKPLVMAGQSQEYFSIACALCVRKGEWDLRGAADFTPPPRD
jgi:hypothetical protein